MTTVATRITRIRRLLNDVNEQEFTDAQIIATFAREEQKFARDSLHIVRVVTIAAPPHIEYCICFSWEEGYVDSLSVFSPFYRNATIESCTQCWEPEEDFTQESEGGYTVTEGEALVHVSAEHPVPFILPDDFFKMVALVWDKKWVEEKTVDWVFDNEIDPFTDTGDVVDWFAIVREGAKKAFFSHSTPTTRNSSVVNEQSAIHATIFADAFYAFYFAVPDRVTADSETVGTYEPFQKYVDYAVAARLLRWDTKKKDFKKAAHFEVRRQIGLNLVRRVMKRLYDNKRFGFGKPAPAYQRRPPRPRLPDHYPKLEA